MNKGPKPTPCLYKERGLLTHLLHPKTAFSIAVFVLKQMELIPGLPDDIAKECLARVPYKQFCRVYSLCEGWKEEIRSVDFHRRRKSAGLAQTLVILAQADDDATSLSSSEKFPPTPAYWLKVYEPATDSWGRLPAIPDCPNGLPVFCQLVGLGHYLVVIGGLDCSTWKSSSSVFVFNFLTATWKRGNDVPGPRRSFFGCASDSRELVFVAGGHDEEKNALKTCFMYNVRKDEWISVPDMARARDECKAFFHQGKFRVIGGYCTEVQGEFGKSAEAFDAGTWEWDNVDEDYLIDNGICPRICVADEEGKMYWCSEDHLAVQDGGMWRSLIQLPADVRVGPFIVMWQGRRLLVIGSDVSGGTYKAYVLDLKGKRTTYKWEETDIPKGFKGKVQSGCSLEI